MTHIDTIVRTNAIARGLLESYETPAFWRDQAAQYTADSQYRDAYLCDRRARDLEALYGFTGW